MASDLLRFKKSLILALVAAMINALCFGAGLGMMQAAIALLTKFSRNSSETLAHLFEPMLERVASVHEGLAAWLGELMPYLPTDPFIAFCSVLGVILVLTGIGNVARFVHEWLTLTVVMRTAMFWRGKLMRKLLHSPFDQLLGNGRSENLVRILNDTNVLAAALRIIFGRAAGELLKACAGLTTAFMINWKLTLLAMVGAPIIGVLLRKFGKIIRKATKLALVQRAKLTASILEVLDGMSVVKVFGAEGYERRRFSNLNRGLFQEEQRMRTARVMSSPMVDMFAMTGVVLIGSVAAWLIFRQGEPAEEFIGVLVCLAASATAVKPLSNVNNQLYESSAAADRISEMLEADQEPSSHEDARQYPLLKRHRQSVTFEKVSYTYPTQDRPAIENISLSIKHGMEVAIVGGNGSGKSTLLNLVSRLFTPSSGRVCIDGQDIASVNLRSLRKQIAVVTQQSVLFEGTVAENIAYNYRHLSPEQIVEAAKLAYADEFIQELPGGYDYQLAESGHGLSGGQRQRLCIARAILRNPAILVLDEATSQIDADSEAKINEALHEIRSGRTVLVIAHRLSTVIDADLIVVMDNGHILDQGTHQELLGRCHAYQVLTQTQLYSS